MANPFDLADEASYQAWRVRKLGAYPRRVEELIVEVADPRHLTPAEHAAILDRCRRANMAIYASTAHTEADKDLPRRMGEQFGLVQFDHNLLADEDAISTLTVAEEETSSDPVRAFAHRPRTRPERTSRNDRVGPCGRRVRGHAGADAGPGRHAPAP